MERIDPLELIESSEPVELIDHREWRGASSMGVSLPEWGSVTHSPPTSRPCRLR
jgi:hypothetical protein